MVFQLIQEQLKKIIYFLAIKGKKNDGNKFINDALKKGLQNVLLKSSIKKIIKK